MKIIVDAKPGAKKESVEKIDPVVKIRLSSKATLTKLSNFYYGVDDMHFVISVKEPPQKGRANKAVCSALADYFQVAPSRIKIVSGRTSHRKILEIK